jgi:dipeptidyl aminopeptidase/acylaminoacyl peptidase
MFVDWANEAGADRATEWYLRGTPFTSLEAYQKNSAALHANLAKTPTLFITKSTTTGLPPPQGMGWMYSALRENHVDTQYVLYRDENHVLEKQENQRDLIIRILAWLQEHLSDVASH